MHFQILFFTFPRRANQNEFLSILFLSSIYWTIMITDIKNFQLPILDTVRVKRSYDASIWKFHQASQMYNIFVKLEPIWNIRRRYNRLNIKVILNLPGLPLVWKDSSLCTMPFLTWLSWMSFRTSLCSFSTIAMMAIFKSTSWFSSIWILKSSPLLSFFPSPEVLVPVTI